MNELSSFKKLLFYSIVSVYLVILAGSVVRASGSGMGCPDWPKCFGQYIPPIDESQLPIDYKTRYIVKGHEAIFNPLQTWVEYVNRLFGAVSGLVILLLFVRSIKLNKYSYQYISFSFLTLLLMGGQAILGAGVVSSFLKPIIISLHMLLALVIIALLLYMYSKVSVLIDTTSYEDEKPIIKHLGFFTVLMFVQLFLGVNVREYIDVFSSSHINRELWIDSLGLQFYIHRSFSIVLFLYLTYITFKAYKSKSKLFNSVKFIYGLTVLIISAGIGLAYFNFPAFIQPIHFVSTTVNMGVLMFILFNFILGQNKTSA
jgi:cytochrome c oxidase assembly protein subunit 15